jgi:RecA-family ATPase
MAGMSDPFAPSRQAELAARWPNYGPSITCDTCDQPAEYWTMRPPDWTLDSGLCWACCHTAQKAGQTIAFSPIYLSGGRRAEAPPDRRPQNELERALERQAAGVADVDGVELATVRACHVEPKKVKWLWPGRIPAGKVTVLDGDPGLGKSTITLDLTARLTTASPLPDGHRPEGPICVLLLSAEDGVEDTIVPRLKVAGADLRKVTIVDHVADEDGPRPVELPGDAAMVERWLASYLYADDDDAAPVTPGLVVVDPLMAFLGGQVNAHRDQDIRRALYPLKLLAERTGVAVVVVRHLNKTGGSNPLYRGGGSIGIIGAARAGLLVAPDPDDEHRRILAVAKSNLAAKAPSLAYRLVGDDLYGAARITWDGASDHTADDLLDRPVERAAPKREQAEEFLRQALAVDARPVAWLQKTAQGKGISWDTVKRAKEALEVIVERRGEEGRRGGGSWWWRLPAGQLSIKEGAIKEGAINSTPDAPLNPDPETAGQEADSEGPEVKESMESITPQTHRRT